MRPLCMSLPTDARPAELPSVSAAQISPCFSWKERRTPIQGPHRLPSKRHRHACMSCLVVNGLTSMTTSLFFFSFPFERVHSQVRARYICTLSETPVTLQVRSWAKVATSWSADSDMRMCWSGVLEGGGVYTLHDQGEVTAFLSTRVVDVLHQMRQVDAIRSRGRTTSLSRAHLSVVHWFGSTRTDRSMLSTQDLNPWLGASPKVPSQNRTEKETG